MLLFLLLFMREEVRNLYDRVTLFGLAGIGTIFSHLTGVFTPLIILLLGFSVIDFITDVAVLLKNSKKPDKNTLFMMFVRKVCVLIMIALAFGFDILVYLALSVLGINLGWGAYFGVLSMFYLVALLGLDILENLEEFEVEIPFLSVALKTFKEKIQGSNK